MAVELGSELTTHAASVQGGKLRFPGLFFEQLVELLDVAVQTVHVFLEFRDEAVEAIDFHAILLLDGEIELLLEPPLVLLGPDILLKLLLLLPEPLPLLLAVLPLGLPLPLCIPHQLITPPPRIG